jgi:UDP-GlcNAc:undecaprenyl-phosphate GlcNAc-1-phosphate transferase
MLALMVLVAASVSFCLSWVILKVSRKYRLYPKIRERDVHERPTPRLGGIAMFVALIVAFLIASRIPFFRAVFTEPQQILAILGAALLIVIVGVADDIWDLDWTIKLAAQLLVAALVTWQGVQIISLPIGGITVGSPLLSFLLTLFTIVLVMNAVNFIDGLDGLVAGVAIIANGVFLVYSYLLARDISPTNYFSLASLTAAVLVGMCLGFLPFNWHRARLFMGDAGSMLVGLLMATSAISVTGQVDPVALGRSQVLPAFLPIVLPIAVLIVPLADFALAVFRRLRAGKSPFTADRKHLHHRLLDMGHSHLHAVLIFYGWTSVISLGLLLFFFIRPWGIPLALILLGLIACTFVTLAPLSRRKRFESAVQSATANPALEQFDPLDRASAVYGDEIPVPENLPTGMATTSPPSHPSSQPEKK